MVTVAALAGTEGVNGPPGTGIISNFTRLSGICCVYRSSFSPAASCDAPTPPAGTWSSSRAASAAIDPAAPAQDSSFARWWVVGCPLGDRWSAMRRFRLLLILQEYVRRAGIAGRAGRKNGRE